MTAYYNEFDPKAAAVVRELIKAGHIAPGVVDERSIEDVVPAELVGYTQCHFFAGFGVWSYALRRAGWPDNRPIWTASCPCQPFSAAGKAAGFADERHLWPSLYHLIDQLRPAEITGEQVASKDADPWIDLVQADLEALGYAFGGVPFPSAGVGAPHIRDRIYWHGLSRTRRVAHDKGLRRRKEYAHARRSDVGDRTQGIPAGPMHGGGAGGAGPTNGFWASADWLGCLDEKWRPVEPRPQPLVDGSSRSLGRVCDSRLEEIEGEVNAWSMESQVKRAEAMRNLLVHLGAQTQRCWAAGRLPGLHEAPFLLAFMRQLQEQGWRVAEGVALPREEAADRDLRVLWSVEEIAGASCERGLEGQPTGEPSDAVRFLSCLLARHASEAWADAYAAHAEIGFPLATGAQARVARLRGFGNAINAEAAKAFIEAVMEATP